MGQIRKRGTYYQIRYYRNGKRIEETTEHTKYDEARDLLKKREGAIADGIPITATSTRLKFDDAVKDVITDYKLNEKKSLKHLQRRIDKHLAPFFGGKFLRSINTADVRTFAARRLEAGAAPAEVNREMAIVRRAFRLAVKMEKYHGRVPVIENLAENNVRTGFFDGESFKAVHDNLPAALQSVVTFAYITGWRITSEVLPLEWRQVDRTARTVRLDPGTTKNKHGRSIDYGDNAELCDLFDALWKEHQALKLTQTICPYVFHRNGKRIRDFRAAWESACTDAGYPGRIPHDLRRSAVRNLVRAGTSDKIAMRITGHRTRSVFDRYDITSEADVREGLGRVSGAVGTKRGDNQDAATDTPETQTA